MPASFEFSYKFTRLKEGIVPYPIVPIYLPTANGKERFDFIVDTGADLTTMPYFMIQILGLDKNNLDRSNAQGIGRQRIKTLEGKVRVEFCQKTLK